MTEYSLRKITSDDFSQWLPLWEGYQRHYKTNITAEVTDITWRRLLDPEIPMSALVADHNDTLVGLVHFVFHHSTWTAGPYVYLQDLFTSEKARRTGIASALFREVYARAQDAGAARVYWLTHESNATAISFYEKVADLSGFIQFRRTLDM